jgi:tRNA pseudouridine55 synthase
MDLIINFNKPQGISSQDAVTKVKRIFRAKKAGHTGTLDPNATGVLLICLNKATRLTPYLTSLEKEYKVVMKLGEATDTQDAQGNVIKKSNSIEIEEAVIKDILRSFEGEILQRPPIFSALKYKGKPLYKYARKGRDVEIKPRKVHIHRIELLNIDLPFVSFKAICSKGTYMRTLCNDIGERLGIGAHLFKLERTAIGKFHISNSISTEELHSINLHDLLDKGIYTMDSALSWMPELRVDKSIINAVKNGAPIKIKDLHSLPFDLGTATAIKIKSPDNKLLAIGSFLRQKNIVKMDVVF